MKKWTNTDSDLREASMDEEFKKTVVKLSKAISDFEPLLGKREFAKASAQKDKKALMHRFTGELQEYLSKCMKHYQFEPEIQADGVKDRYDLCGAQAKSPHSCRIVIEIDASRADQVAKKFLSRSALLIEKPLIYVAMVYPGTLMMNRNECQKYFGYCAAISRKLSTKKNSKAFLAFWVEPS